MYNENYTNEIIFLLFFRVVVGLQYEKEKKKKWKKKLLQF